MLQGFPPLAPASVVPQYNPQIIDNKPGNRPVPTVLNQCVAEQRYVRQSMTRTLLYAQVSGGRPPWNQKTSKNAMKRSPSSCGR